MGRYYQDKNIKSAFNLCLELLLELGCPAYIIEEELKKSAYSFKTKDLFLNNKKTSAINS